MWGDTFFRSLGTCALGFFFYPPPSPLQECRLFQGSFSDGASMLLYGTVPNCYCEHAYLLSFDKTGVL